MNFADPADAQAYAMAMTLCERGVLRPEEWERALAADGAVSGLERLVVEHGLASASALERYRMAWAAAAWRTPHGAPVELRGEDFG